MTPSRYVTFRQPGFKLVMARTEVRKDNGDLEVPPRIFRRVAGHWEPVDWGNLPDEPGIRGLIKAMKRRRDAYCPKCRNPIGNLPLDRVAHIPSVGA